MYSKGDRIKHPAKPEWGLGQILSDPLDNKVRVLFVNAGEKTLSMGHVSLVKVTGPEAVHPLLDSPRARKQPQKKGKSKREVISLDEAKRIFINAFPEGFKDSAFEDQERNYKLDAHELIVSLLDEKEYKKLLKAEDYSEICKRSLQLVNKTNLIFPNEKMELKDGLASARSKRNFAETLYELLYGKGTIEDRFTSFAGCLLSIGAAKWTIVTYFLFLRFPNEHMFLKPMITKKTAELTGFELNYNPSLNWLTYYSLLKFAEYMKLELTKRGLKPKDMIDVQSFIWCIAQE